MEEIIQVIFVKDQTFRLTSEKTESNDICPINSLAVLSPSHCLGTAPWSKISPALVICVTLHILRQQAVIHPPSKSKTISLRGNLGIIRE